MPRSDVPLHYAAQSFLRLPWLSHQPPTRQTRSGPFSRPTSIAASDRQRLAQQEALAPRQTCSVWYPVLVATRIGCFLDILSFAYEKRRSKTRRLIRLFSCLHTMLAVAILSITKS